MKFLVIDNAEPRHSKFNKPLVSFASTFVTCDVVHYSQLPLMDNSMANYAAVVVSGVPMHYSFDSLDLRLSYFAWLVDTPLPVLGICLGHQLIGRQFGGKIIKNREAEKGAIAVRLYQSDPLFAGLPVTVAAQMMHRASVEVPAGFTLLASTPACRNVIMKHGTKPIYGLQFHPEFSKDGIRLFENFVQLAAELQKSSTPQSLDVSDLSSALQQPA